MKTPRLVANLLAFAVISLALIAYGVFDLLGDPLESSTPVSAVFPDASGVYPNFSVELDGVTVGTVSGVVLTPHGARVDMAINHGMSVPDDVVASIQIANDLGEQVVELTPENNARVRALKSGAQIPVAKDAVPAQVGAVVASATRLLDAIPAGRVNQLLTELATSLQNRAGDLRTIISASTTFSNEFLAFQHQFEQLLANSPPVLDAVSAAGPQLQQALVNTEALVQTFANHKGDVAGLLEHGSAATGQLQGLLANQAPDFACLIHDFSQLSTNLAQPTNLSNLSTSLATSQDFFGAVSHVAVQGTAKALTSGEKDTPNQYFLRTRLLLPPKSPSGIAYASQTGLPPVSPGAGCTTEFGQGAGPATQPGFQPAAGGTLNPPKAADAVVRGRGDPAQGPSGQASYRKKVAGPDLVPLGLLGALLLPAFGLAWGARPSRSRARRRG